MQSERDECLTAGMDDFLAKPIVPQALADILTKWLPQPCEPQQPDLALTPGEFEMSTLVESLMGNKELAARVLNSFLEDMPRQLESLRHAVDSGNTQSIAHRAHTIKGTAGAVCCGALRALASDMEAIAPTADTDLLRSYATKLDVQFARFRQTALQDQTHSVEAQP
jgi:HPt (histidine-containing phosphotransfer) domain-containing protein